MNSYTQVPTGNTSQDLRRTISEFIKSYVGNDPLEPWTLCIKWLKETYPPGSVQPVLQEVLEACTKNFLADRRYKSDLRYLRVWIQYADCCTEPGAIFPFLEANGVGLEHSLFYEAYATLLEYCRDFAKANDVYGVGISRQAQPVERLKSMYQLFCNRMMARHKRKVREDQKAFAARIQGGAQRPLVDQYSAGDLGQFQAFQNPIIKGVQCAPLPDMHVGNVGEIHGGPAPILIGSEIYESTSKGEASFEEQRLLRWTQNRNEQRSVLKCKTFGIDEHNVGSSPSSRNVKGAMRESQIPQSSNRRAAEMMGFSFGGERSNMHEIPRQNVLLNSNALQVGHYEQAHYVKSNSQLLGGFQTVNVCAPLQTTLPPIKEPVTSPRLSLGFQNLPTAGTHCPDEFIVAGVDPNAIDRDTTSHGVLLDCTVNTRSVTEDILSMFSGPLACEQLKPKTPPSGFIKGKVPSSGTQEVNFQFSYNQEAKSPQLTNEKLQREILPHSRLQDSAVKPRDSTVRLGYNGGNAIYKSSNTTLGHDLALTIDVKEPNHSLAGSGAVVLKDYIVSAYPPHQESWSQAVAHEDASKTVCYREGIQASGNVDYCAEAKSIHQESGDKKSSSFQQMENFDVFQNHDPPASAVVEKSSAFISQQLSPVWEDTESPAGNCNSMEGPPCRKAGVGLRQDLNIGHMDTNYTDETPNLRVVAGTKRPLEPTDPAESQSLMTENGQHSSHEHENGNVVSQESKKPRVHLTSVSVEGHDVIHNDNMIAKMDKVEVMVGNQESSSLPEPGRMVIGRCTNLSASLQATSPRRIIAEAKPSSRGGRTTGSVVLTEKVYPWDDKLIKRFLDELHPPLNEYKGFFRSTKKYSGKVTLASLKSGVKNKTLELGREKYQLKGCTGRGAFAQVYLAEVLVKNGGDGQRIVLKVQKPACPWEFYIYRQLDIRIPFEERASFGRAQNMHIYADCSFMVCDFGEHGTLQDVINAYLAKGQRMDEGLCLYYTIEMLLMLENLHKVGLIHGDFKPDNLLIRSTSEQLQSWSPDRPGCWKNQGVCLIDWGRSIDTTLFTDGTEFVGDSKTDGFRCTEMLEKKPWTYQVDTYGLCGVVHCLLHGSYMEVEKRSVVASSQPIYRPKAPFKRYWNVELWQNFFDTLLNLKTGKSHKYLISIRKSFEDYLQSDPGLVKKLRELLAKQNTMLRSRK